MLKLLCYIDNVFSIPVSNPDGIWIQPILVRPIHGADDTGIGVAM